MKKIINGKLYSTETAYIIGNYTIGQIGDLDWIEETLYKTNNRNWFLISKSGRPTKYATRVDHINVTETNLTPISQREALHWCEQHNVDPDITQLHFTIEKA